nr:ruBisCO large subunit-binding protein subunit beta, chloroplastic [Ipomoea batatas]
MLNRAAALPRRVVVAAGTDRRKQRRGRGKLSHVHHRLCPPLEKAKLAVTFHRHCCWDLQRATYNFSTLIGQGAYEPVYKAQLSTGESVAVKVLAMDSKQGEKEFQTEVVLLGRLHHKNLVNLLGYCAEKGQNMLIYVYMSKGSLASQSGVRVEDALNATKAAVEEGIVVGGGCTLLRLSSKVDALKESLENEEEKASLCFSFCSVGADIVKRALSYPLKLIAKNAGVNGSVVRLSSDNPKYGYNAATGNYEDLMAAGIIDPTKVVRCCLEHASSVAKTFLMSDCVVVEIKEPEPVKAGNPMDNSAADRRKQRRTLTVAVDTNNGRRGPTQAPAAAAAERSCRAEVPTPPNHAAASHHAPSSTASPNRRATTTAAFRSPEGEKGFSHVAIANTHELWSAKRPLPCSAVRRRVNRGRRSLIAAPCMEDDAGGGDGRCRLLCFGRRRCRRSRGDEGEREALLAGWTADRRKQRRALTVAVDTNNGRRGPTQAPAAAAAERSCRAEVPTPPNHAAALHHAPPSTASPNRRATTTAAFRSPEGEKGFSHVAIANTHELWSAKRPLPCSTMRRRVNRGRRSLIAAPCMEDDAGGGDGRCRLLCFGRRRCRRSRGDEGEREALLAGWTADRRKQRRALTVAVDTNNGRRGPTQAPAAAAAERSCRAEVPTPPNHAAASHHAPPSTASPNRRATTTAAFRSPEGEKGEEGRLLPLPAWRMTPEVEMVAAGCSASDDAAAVDHEGTREREKRCWPAGVIVVVAVMHPRCCCFAIHGSPLKKKKDSTKGRRKTMNELEMEWNWLLNLELPYLETIIYILGSLSFWAM